MARGWRGGWGFGTRASDASWGCGRSHEKQGCVRGSFPKGSAGRQAGGGGIGRACGAMAQVWCGKGRGRRRKRDGDRGQERHQQPTSAHHCLSWWRGQAQRGCGPRQIATRRGQIEVKKGGRCRMERLWRGVGTVERIGKRISYQGGGVSGGLAVTSGASVCMAASSAVSSSRREG